MVQILNLSVKLLELRGPQKSRPWKILVGKILVEKLAVAAMEGKG